MVLLAAVLLGLGAIAAGCDDGGGEGERDTLADASGDTPPPEDGTLTDSAEPDGSVPDSDTTSDAGDGDVVEPLPPLETRDPASAPPDPLVGSGVESCAVYQEERCAGGTLQRCAVYDTASRTFVAPDAQLERVFLFDRWYDLYHQPVGQTAERVFAGETLPGTPEAAWGAAEHFARYTGLGDAAIWNGAALLSDAMRYLATGTEADYQRMEQKVRDVLLQFEVSGVPGYLARYHFVVVDDGAPQDPRYVIHHASETLDHKSRVIESAAALAALPEPYQGTYTAPDGSTWPATPMWKGHPSIDQYSGPRAAFTVVHGLLRDAELQARIEHHLTCYLKSLQRIEIVNLQDNPELLEALNGYFAGANPKLDPGDLDFASLDRIVMYVHRQLNTTNEQSYPRTCPESVQLEPWRVIDAGSQSFLTDTLSLVADLQSGDSERPNGINHFYVPSVRGGDALHLMHLAAQAYHWTGDEQYRRFLFEELIGELDALAVARTAGAFNLPEFCRKFYGHHIGFTPAWALLALLEDSSLRDALAEVYEVEMWQKEMATHDNAKFNLLYGGEVPDAIASSGDAAVAVALEKLAELGGNGGVLADPRRTYTVDRAALLEKMAADGNALRCPSEAERALCEDPIVLLGVPLPSTPITFECTGAPGECPMENGSCAWGLARDALPMGDRRYEDFAWQRNPFEIGVQHDPQGSRQSPGLDLTEEFWLARWYGFTSAGAGQVLGWEELGGCP